MNEPRIPKDDRQEFFGVTMFGRRIIIDWSNEPPTNDDGTGCKCRVFPEEGRIVLWRVLSPDDIALLLGNALAKIAERWAMLEAAKQVKAVEATIPAMVNNAVALAMKG